VGWIVAGKPKAVQGAYGHDWSIFRRHAAQQTIFGNRTLRPRRNPIVRRQRLLTAPLVFSKTPAGAMP
jgi:hypothetical protein